MTATSQSPGQPGERVFIGLGANLGDRQAQLRDALRRLAGAGVELVRCSSWYETEPVGGPPQPDYLNGVVEVRTSAAPIELLARCLAVEGEMGRIRGVRAAPRNVDLDLILYGARMLNGPDLVIPHPRALERRFVLAPLAEIAPHVVPPGQSRTVRELLADCPDRSRVTLSSPACSPPGADL